MSNRFKFRGLCLKAGKLVYGQLIKDDERAFILSGDIEVHVDDKEVWGDLIEVDAKSVGQSTGLLDGDGIVIFEGDIVRLSMDGLGAYTGEARFVKGAFRSHPHNFTIGGLLGGETSRVSVIGNIHENPELLEQST